MDENFKVIEKLFNDKFDVYGYSPKALGWDKGKQDIRFDVLTSMYDFKGKKILDIGCGFGDLNHTLQRKFGDDYSYYGIELSSNIAQKGKELFLDKPNITIENENFLDKDFKEEKFDYAIVSGIFNSKFAKEEENKKFVLDVMTKANALCKDGFAFDFLSDKVDYKLEHAHHSSPAEILEYAYSFSRRVILRNDYMPFEFAIFVFKNTEFEKANTTYTDFLKSHDISMGLDNNL